MASALGKHRPEVPAPVRAIDHLQIRGDEVSDPPVKLLALALAGMSSDQAQERSRSKPNLRPCGAAAREVHDSLPHVGVHLGQALALEPDANSIRVGDLDAIAVRAVLFLNGCEQRARHELEWDGSVIVGPRCKMVPASRPARLDEIQLEAFPLPRRDGGAGRHAGHVQGAGRRAFAEVNAPGICDVGTHCASLSVPLQSGDKRRVSEAGRHERCSARQIRSQRRVRGH